MTLERRLEKSFVRGCIDDLLSDGNVSTQVKVTACGYATLIGSGIAQGVTRMMGYDVPALKYALVAGVMISLFGSAYVAIKGIISEKPAF